MQHDRPLVDSAGAVLRLSHYLRTGRDLPEPPVAAFESKYNRWHDPANGQFTFAPGGARYPAGTRPSRLRQFAAGSRVPPAGGMGGNIRPFQVPMTLKQVFPGLQSAPAGALVALAIICWIFRGRPMS